MFYRKWKIRNFAVLDVRSAAHLEALLEACFSLQVSNVLGVCRGVQMWLHILYAKAIYVCILPNLIFMIYSKIVGNFWYFLVKMEHKTKNQPISERERKCLQQLRQKEKDPEIQKKKRKWTTNIKECLFIKVKWVKIT